MEKMLGIGRHTCHPSEGVRLKLTGLCSRLTWAKSKTLPTFKITRARWAGGVAHVAEHLPSEPKALSSNPVLFKIKQNKLKTFRVNYRYANLG
jgi:hypothetical protein